MSLEDPQALLRSLILVKTSTYVPIASAGLFLYDYLLTLFDEIRLVWRAPWSLGKALFLITRYPTFVDVGMTVYHNIGHSLPVETCQLLYEITGWMFIAGMVIAEIIMVIRVWALWNRSRTIGILLILLSIIGIVVTAISFTRFRGDQTFIAMDDVAPTLNGCFPGPGTNVVFIGYLMLMAYETIVMGLLLLKGLQHFRHVSSGFLYTFYQDGIVYYALLLLISVLNVAILLSGPPQYANLLTTLQRTLHSVLSARILLHLRNSYRSRQVMFSNTPAAATSMSGVSGLVFADPGQGNMTRRPVEIVTWFGDGRAVAP